MDSHKNEKSVNVHVIPTKPAEQDKPPRPKTFWHMDKVMLRFKVYYFLFAGGVAAGIPFTVVLAKDRIGISASSLGAVLTAQMFLFIFSKTLMGYLADYFNKLKAMITVLTITYTACYFSLLTLPPIEAEHFNILNKITWNDTLAVQNVSINCSKYQKMFYNALSEHDNVTSLKFASVSKDTSVMLDQLDKYDCLPVYETDFYNPIMNYISVNNLNAAFKEIQANDTTSNSLKFIFVVSEKTPTNMCINPGLQEVFPFKNISHIFINRKCIFQSVFAATFNSSLLPTVEFLCASCDFQYRTWDSLKNTNAKNHKKKDIYTYQFWLFTLFYTLAGLCCNAVFTLSDTACYESIQKHGGDFGQQRLWGGIGWGAIAPLAGFINDYTDDFLASYILMGAMMALFLWNIFKIDLVKPHFSKNILKDVRTVLKAKEFIMFEVMVFVNGLGTGMIWFYLIWFLNSIGGSELLCGLTMTVQAFLGVIPFMFFSGFIINKLGHFNILILSLLGYTFRFLWYSYLHNPWLVLPVEFLHGVTYGLYYTTLASYAKLSAKPGTEATTQAIIFSTHEGLGSGIGCIISGISFDYLGGHQTFFYSSLICLCGALIGLVLSLHLRKRKGIINVENT